MANFGPKTSFFIYHSQAVVPLSNWTIFTKRLTQIYSPIIFVVVVVVVVVDDINAIDDFNAKVIQGLFCHSWHTCWVPKALSALLAKETILIKDLKVLSSERAALRFSEKAACPHPVISLKILRHLLQLLAFRKRLPNMGMKFIVS